MPKTKRGICALTRRQGQYVKAHIIPKALTPREIPGSLMFQSDGIGRYQKRWDSWYDLSLVIRKGEDLLEEIDDKAIKLIRANKLAWKYWEHPSELSMEAFKGGAMIGLRSIGEIDQEVLGRFAVSLLWRAGASQTPDMQSFVVSESLLEQARQVTKGAMPFDPSVFPIKVFQYGTKGPIHNLTPMNHTLTKPNGKPEPFFRIFANGLFFHVVDTTGLQPYDLGEASWYLGNQDRLDVICFDFAASTQNEFATAVFDHFLSQQN